MLCILEGAAKRLTRPEVRVTREQNFDQPKPEETPVCGNDLVEKFNIYYEDASAHRWQALLLLGCSLLNTAYRGRRESARNQRTCKNLARYVISLLNSLFPTIGTKAFTVIAAMSSMSNIVDADPQE